MTLTFTRCQTAAQVAAIAAANHASFTRSAHAASVELPGVTYWWAAA